MRIDLSLIIVNWNTKDLLKECIKSIFSASGSLRIEIIVSDNGSTDGSLEMLSSYFPQVRCVENNENLGFAKANNRAIQYAVGRYICLVNSDVKVLGNCLNNIIAYLDKNKDIGMCAPRLLNGDLTVQKNCKEYLTILRALIRAFTPVSVYALLTGGKKNSIHFFNYDRERDVEALSGAFIIVKSKVYHKVGGLDERFFFYAEDIDWGYRFHKAGYKIRFSPVGEAIHYGGKSTEVAPVKYRLELLKADLAYIYKYYGLFGQYIYKIISIIHHLLRTIGMALFFPVVKTSKKYKWYFIKREGLCFIWLFFTYHRLIKKTKKMKN